jgi:hypothetical protein
MGRVLKLYHGTGLLAQKATKTFSKNIPTPMVRVDFLSTLYREAEAVDGKG